MRALKTAWYILLAAFDDAPEMFFLAAILVVLIFIGLVALIASPEISRIEALKEDECRSKGGFLMETVRGQRTRCIRGVEIPLEVK